MHACTHAVSVGEGGGHLFPHVEHVSEAGLQFDPERPPQRPEEDVVADIICTCTRVPGRRGLERAEAGARVGARRVFRRSAIFYGVAGGEVEVDGWQVA